ncbi:MAG: YitT family protein [Veillonella sp.]|uniref:YitT family protein n=1 Tax=Veillonella sp. TaxID=1926307 RepID=UPI0025E9B408|nr:YitT family protein [Veillonella sp.]MBS4913393.1 YitT family protein [Veillonella sp.]
MKWRQTANALIMTTIGSIIFAIGIDAFIVPHKLVSGSLSGVALMLYYMTGIQVGTLNLILNIPILYAAYRWLGRWHVGITIFGTIVISICINMLTFMEDYALTSEPLVGSLIGGILCGLGLGVVYRSGGNTGGLDPIALIIRKYYGLQMGSIIFGINVIILIAAAIVVSVEAAAITLVSIYVMGMVTNKVVVGFNQRKAAFIISSNPHQICELIINNMGRGATLLDGEGAYTHQHRQVVMVVVGLMQVAKLKDYVQRVDPGAFMIITDAAEVIGQGFTMPIVKPAGVERALSEADCKSVETGDEADK